MRKLIKNAHTWWLFMRIRSHLHQPFAPLYVWRRIQELTKL